MNRADFDLLSILIDNILSIEPNSTLQRSLAAEPENICRDLCCQLLKMLILIIQYTDLSLRLVLGDARLCVNVALHRMMAVQMIRCDI